MPVSPHEEPEPVYDERDTNSGHSGTRLYRASSDPSYLSREIQSLKTRNAWLTGAVLGLFLGMGGLGGWLVLSTRNSAQTQTTEELAQAQDPSQSRIQQIEQEITALREQIPTDLVDSLRNNQSTIQRLEAQLQQLISKLEQLQIDPSKLKLPGQGSEDPEPEDATEVDDASSSISTPRGSQNPASSPSGN